MLGISSNLGIKMNNANMSPFQVCSLPLHGETFTQDELFIVEAVTEDQDYMYFVAVRLEKKMHFRPTLLTASCPQYNAMQDLRC